MLLLLFGGLRVRSNPTKETVLTNKPSGPYFTRKRFDKILEEIARAEEAERKRLEALNEQKLKQAFADFRSPADRRIAELLEQANAAAARVAQLPFGAPTLPQVHDLSGLALAHQRMAQDEDDAEAMLLLNG